jgi:hypothetical protein
MFRRGVYKIEQIKKNQLLDIFGKEKNISIKVYDDLLLEEDANYENLSEIILNRFNANSNAIKRTYRNRFNEFDLNSIQKIKGANFTDIKIHDMAISDGRASSFFIKNCLKNFPNFEYTGSDLVMSYELSWLNQKRNQYIITDTKGEIIEITIPPFVWNIARKEGKLYFLNNLLKNHCLKKYNSVLKSGRINVSEKIRITDKEFSQLIQSNSNFNLKNYNLFESDSSTYNVIRVMNIMHFGYFNEEQLQLIFNNIYNSLEENGLLIEGSNEDAGSSVEGGIYQKTKSGFTLLVEPEKKSRILESILNFKPKN